MKKKNKIISIIFYILSMVFLLYYGYVELSSNIFMSTFGRLFLLCGCCLFLYLGALFLSKYRKDNKAMKINLWIFFVLFCGLLITLTLFDPMWGRNGLSIFNWSQADFSKYFNYYVESSVNLIPFKTIIGYTKDIFTSLLDTSNIFANLLGNLICMMPFAFFIPMLFKKINNAKKFLLIILCITLGIELIQFITFSGSCDIDDVILNTLGALIMYRILNIKDIKNLIKNIFLLEKNKIDKKKLVKVLTPIIVVVVLCFGFYKIGSRFYDNNLDDFISKYNYKVEIIDETESCDTALELFYESELYEYYFDCIKSDYVYARINDGEKYLVKELLTNNPTDYVISIDKFERAGLKFTKKEKYEKINLYYEGNVYLSKENIEDESILRIGWGNSIQGEYLSQEVFLIPKKEGTTLLSLDIYNGSTSELVETLKYEITINSSLEVSYKEID
ncbi:MAG: VanZ family protein [Firmicutes bacterium]|nr:VanZ family protein [Bacillota bacterium]